MNMTGTRANERSKTGASYAAGGHRDKLRHGIAFLGELLTSWSGVDTIRGDAMTDEQILYTEKQAMSSWAPTVGGR